MIIVEITLQDIRASAGKVPFEGDMFMEEVTELAEVVPGFMWSWVDSREAKEARVNCGVI